MVCLIFLEEGRVGVGLGIFRAGEGLGDDLGNIF